MEKSTPADRCTLKWLKLCTAVVIFQLYAPFSPPLYSEKPKTLHSGAIDCRSNAPNAYVILSVSEESAAEDPFSRDFDSADAPLRMTGVLLR